MPYGPTMGRTGGRSDPLLPEVIAQVEAQQKRDPATRAAMERSPELRASLKEAALMRAIEIVRKSILTDETLSSSEKIEKLKSHLIRTVALLTPSEIPMGTISVDETDEKDNS